MDLWIVNPDVVKRYSRGEAIESIAADCGADAYAVRRAITEKTTKRRPKHGKTGLRTETIPKLKRARKLRAKGKTYREIGESLGMSTVGAYGLLKAHPEPPK